MALGNWARKQLACTETMEASNSLAERQEA